MLLHGDELGRTQQGNNNTYAQDSELSWVHWDNVDQPLLEFTAAVVRLRAEPPDLPPQAVLHRHHRAHRADGQERLNDIVWLHPDGHPMEDDDWRRRRRRSSACTSTATASPARTPRRDHPRRPLPALLQRRRPGRPDAAAGRVRRGVGRRHQHRRLRGRTDTALAAGRRSTSSTAACWCSRSTPSPRPSPTCRSPPSWRRSPDSRRQTGRPAGHADPRQHLPAPDHAAFDLFEAARVLPYLHDLGVDWVYLSPILEAEPGTTTATTSSDHDRVDAARGGRRGAGRAVGRGPAAGHGRARRHRAQPRRRGHAARTPGGGRADHGRVGVRRASTSTGRPAAAGCDPGRR